MTSKERSARLLRHMIDDTHLVFRAGYANKGLKELESWLDENGFAVTGNTIDVTWAFVCENMKDILTSYEGDIEDIVVRRKES